MADEELSYPGKPRIWAAIEHNAMTNDLMKEQVRTFERMFERHLDETKTTNDMINKIKEQMDAHNTKLSEIIIILGSHKKEIESLWAFPLKVFGAIVALGGASTVIYKFAKWFIPNIETRGLH